MKKKALTSLAMLAGAAGLALGVAQGAKAANPDFWFFAAPTPNQNRTANTPSGRFVNFGTSLSSLSSVGGRVQPTQSNVLFGEPTPFTAAIIVACQLPRNLQDSLAQRSWQFNSSQFYPALTKSCLFFGAPTALQGTMNITL